MWSPVWIISRTGAGRYLKQGDAQPTLATVKGFLRFFPTLAWTMLAYRKQTNGGLGGKTDPVC